MPSIMSILGETTPIGHVTVVQARSAISKRSNPDDAGIALGSLGVVLLCVASAVVWLVVREARRRKNGNSGAAGILCFQQLFQRVGGKSSVQTTCRDSLALSPLRRTNTLSYTVASKLAPDGTRYRESNRNYPGRYLSPDVPVPTTRTSDQGSPFSDKYAINSPTLARPPSALVHSELMAAEAYQCPTRPSSTVPSSTNAQYENATETQSIPDSPKSPVRSELRQSLTESTVPPRAESSRASMYTAETTTSTLPPSYRARRPSVVLDVPVLPRSLPWPAAGTTDTVSLPPPAFSPSSRRQNMHGPRRISVAKGTSSIVPAAENSRSGATHQRGHRGQVRKKSRDGGVRLAGGPADAVGDRREDEGDLVLPPAYEVADVSESDGHSREVSQMEKKR
ncbi:hypothetical protein BD413DRAFT_594140 [Trametes elegans]|nr:hypothetical protein BD413DRAFT_594140 [Trametes elegans]